MSNTEQTYDVIVIGGGPAGMMAAFRARERGKRVLLIEKNEVLGKKLSITGGGRCNITNAEYDVRALLAHYGDAEPFLYSPFAQFGVQDTFDFFTAHGLPLVVEEKKRAFPHTQRAKDVTALFTRLLADSGVTILCDTRVFGFVSEKDRIVGVKTSRGVYSADSYVLATGGRSHAYTGATGDGMCWTELLGHTTYAPNPDLVPLMVKESWVKAQSGKALDAVKITFESGAERFSRSGRILFTHFGLSGPLILNAAHDVKRLLTHGDVRVRIDLFPTMDTGALRAHVLAYIEAHKNQMVHTAIRGIVPGGMSGAVLAHLPPEVAELKVHTLSREKRHAIVDVLKSLSCTVTGTMGHDHAIVSDGGVDLREIDMRRMVSRRYANLFLVGDMLHIPRPSGGFSLQLCWTTGWVAGNTA